MLAEAANSRKSIKIIHLCSFLYGYLSTACRNEDCYILLDRNVSNTVQRTVNISDSLEDTNSHLTETLRLLDEATETANETFLYAQHLNTSGAQLVNTFTSIRAGLASSQQQIYNLSSLMTSISANATAVSMVSNDAAMIVNQTIGQITMAIETLDEVEANLLLMLEDVATLITQQSDNGTKLYAELMMQYGLVTSQAAQLFNSSWMILNIMNATVESLMNSYALQRNTSAGVLAQMAVSQDIYDKLDSLSNDLTMIQLTIQFFSIYISTEITSTFPIATTDQILQQLQVAIQLTTDVQSLLGNISMLIDLRRDLYTTLSSYEATYELLPGRIRSLEQGALTLYNQSLLLNQNAVTASQEADQLVVDAQYLQMVLQDFSGFVDTTNELLQSIEAIQTSAVNTINTANNISSMIMDTHQTINDSLLVLMDASNLAEVIETVSTVRS